MNTALRLKSYDETDSAQKFARALFVARWGIGAATAGR
jgi:hypothetical protein